MSFGCACGDAAETPPRRAGLPLLDATFVEAAAQHDASRGDALRPGERGDAAPPRDARVADAPKSLDGHLPVGEPDAAALCTGRTGASGDLQRTVDNRSVLVHVPATYDPTRAAPIILALHGLTSSPEAMRDLTHYNEIADARNWIVAYPDGTEGSWNAGVCCGVAEILHVDDVSFIRDVIADLDATYCVDAGRTYVSGFSNGGFMTHRLGCEVSDRIAAIGVVAGEMGIPTCTPVRPVPVAQAHGTSDPLVPYDGDPLLGFPSTDTTMGGWAARNRCGSPPSTFEVIGDTTCEAWPDCEQDASVQLCTVQGGVHDWFGGGTLWTDAGGPPPGFNASMFFADFFEQHPRLDPPDGGLPPPEGGPG